MKEKNKKEYSENQKLKTENSKLRRQIGKLRKVISRIDFEEYQHVKDLVEAQNRQDTEVLKQTYEDRLKKKWKCWDCEGGILKLVVLFKGKTPYYLRKCDSCDKKTKLQEYTEQIQEMES